MNVNVYLCVCVRWLNLLAAAAVAFTSLLLCLLPPAQF